MSLKSLHLRIDIIVSVFISILSSLPRFIRYENDHSITNLLSALLQFIYIFFCWLICQHALHLRKHYSAYLIYPLLMVTGTVTAILYYTSVQEILPVLPWHESLSDWQRFVMASFRGVLITSFQLFISLYLQTQQEAQKSRIENERLKQENLAARLDILKQQMTPHFLFNALNTISTITQEEPTKEYTLRLAHVYRHLLQFNDSDLASLEDELDFLHAYMYIQQTRFEGALQTHIAISPELMEYRIPTFSLQILIENALKHNAATVQKPLLIEVTAENDEWLVVRNNVQAKRSMEPGTGRGLKNISDRYHLLSGKEIHIDKSDTGFIVKLPLLKP